MNAKRLEDITIDRVEIDMQKRKLKVTASCGQGDKRFDVLVNISVLPDNLLGLAEVLEKIREVAYKDICSKLSHIR